MFSFCCPHQMIKLISINFITVVCIIGNIILKAIFKIIVKIHILNVITFWIVLEIRVYFWKWGVKILVDFEWWKNFAVYFMEAESVIKYSL